MWKSHWDKNGNCTRIKVQNTENFDQEGQTRRVSKYFYRTTGWRSGEIWCGCGKFRRCLKAISRWRGSKNKPAKRLRAERRNVEKNREGEVVRGDAVWG